MPCSTKAASWSATPLKSPWTSKRFSKALKEPRRGPTVPLLVLPPRSAKLNGVVGRAQPTHAEGFNEGAPCSLQNARFGQNLGARELIDIPLRPRQALPCFTPQQVLVRRQLGPRETQRD